MSYPIVLDIETQYSFQEVGYDHKKLKVSVVGIYDYSENKYSVFFENDLNQLFPLLEKASYLIGFNINKFDLPVLSPYYLGNIFQFSRIDLLEEVEKSLGFRLALDDLARATLGVKKSGHGFLAINYYKNKDWEKLKKYCLDDVKITKDLFEYAKKNNKLFFQNVRGKKEIPILLKKKTISQSPVTLSIPF